MFGSSRPSTETIELFLETKSPDNVLEFDLADKGGRLVGAYFDSLLKDDFLALSLGNLVLLCDCLLGAGGGLAAATAGLSGGKPKLRLVSPPLGLRFDC